jgi:triphosphoribosyl-dephospho-CoA synthase
VSAFALPAAVVMQAYRDACRFDVMTFKPGNVSIESAGHGMEARDFLRSAAVSAPWLGGEGLKVGERIQQAVAATRAAVGCNTNLGIVLLAAPLATAALNPSPEVDLQRRLRAVLAKLSVADAVGAFAGIRHAAPGGLGAAADADVRDTPHITLSQAMALAADRDAIAAQYGNDYAAVFSIGLPALAAALASAEHQSEAVLAVYLELLAALPDTHLARKHGEVIAEGVRRRGLAVACLRKACENPDAFNVALRAFDNELKAAGHNPGTTADLTVASLFAFELAQALRECRPPPE